MFDDCCYINNFDEECEFVVLKFFFGGGKVFYKDMVVFIDDVLDLLFIVFDNLGY